MPRVEGEDLARVEDPVRVEGFLEVAVNAQRYLAELAFEQLSLQQADTMFTSDRAPEVEADPHDLVEGMLSADHLVGIVPVEHHRGVEVAVAGMSHHSDDEPTVSGERFDPLNQLRESGAWHAYIVDHRGAEALHRGEHSPSPSQQQVALGRIVGDGDLDGAALFEQLSQLTNLLRRAVAARIWIAPAPAPRLLKRCPCEKRH